MATVSDGQPAVERSDTDGTVSGRLVAVLPSAVEQTCGSFDRFTRQFMAAHGIETLDAERWYSQGLVIELYRQLQTTVGPRTLERIGRFLLELTAFTPQAERVPDRFESGVDWYDQLHRETGGAVRFRTTGFKTGTLVLDTPYPEAFEAGLARGLGRAVQTDSVSVFVRADTESPADLSQYQVSWYHI